MSKVVKFGYLLQLIKGASHDLIETVSGDENVKEQLKLNTYVDNVMGLVANKHQGKQFREEAVKIMEKGKFPLTKWESNLKLLNDDDQEKSQPNF